MNKKLGTTQAKNHYALFSPGSLYAIKNSHSVEFKEEEQIENASIVINHFGYWPSFHDSEVISICYKRNFKESNPSIEFQVYAFEMTNKVKTL